MLVEPNTWKWQVSFTGRITVLQRNAAAPDHSMVVNISILDMHDIEWKHPTSGIVEHRY
ncbi:hypothetical protein JW905_05430 [bacterium]|nr:hypothetical protein [candidate division CSSED10-310 bacterium]